MHCVHVRLTQWSPISKWVWQFWWMRLKGLKSWAKEKDMQETKWNEVLSQFLLTPPVLFVIDFTPLGARICNYLFFLKKIFEGVANFLGHALILKRWYFPLWCLHHKILAFFGKMCENKPRRLHRHQVVLWSCVGYTIHTRGGNYHVDAP